MYTNHAVTGILIELIGKPISLAPLYRAVTASKWVFLLVGNMKTVRVYELSVKHESVPEVDRYIDRSYFNPSNGYPFVEKFTDEVASLNIHHERIEIQEFCSKSLPGHLGANCREMSRVKREYIAIPRDLENLLTVKWQQKISEKQSQLDKESRKLSSTQGELRDSSAAFDSYKDMVKGWWAMPWHKRVWSAIRG